MRLMSECTLQSLLEGHFGSQEQRCALEDRVEDWWTMSLRILFR